jgi:membrane associated rhomboid family serine protease
MEPMGGDEAPKNAAHKPNDGSLDFSSYSLSQLRDLESLIDPATHPLNHLRLREEIARRTAPAGATAPGTPGRYGAREGWRGWWEAKRRRSPVYGGGSIEISGGDLTLHGLQRTWLGTVTPGIFQTRLDRVRNVACDGALLHFEIRRDWLPARHIRFHAVDAPAAAALAQELPRTQSPGFERRWQDMRLFHERVAALGGNAWPVHALLLVNVALFVTMLIAYGRFAPFDAQWLVRWGANFGPLTMDSQWWRLLSAQFLHGDAVHLVANMWVLYNAGRLARQLYGNLAFLAIYLGAGVCGFVFSLSWDPSAVAVGASGAIFGVLAAFIAYMIRQRSQLPAPVLRAHWLSTLLFVGLNLISGAMQPMVDNAAHVGGMLSGFVLGWLLARPLQAEERSRWGLWQGGAATLLVLIVVLGGAWRVWGIGKELNAFDRFGRDFAWYAKSELEQLQKWDALVAQIASGFVSEAEIGRRFRDEIRPFWKDAHERLSADEKVKQAKDSELPAMMREYTLLRRDLASALAAAVESDDEDHADAAVGIRRDLERLQARIERLGFRSRMEYRPRALKHSLAMNRLRGWLSLDPWKCVESAPVTGRKRDAGDAAEDGPARRHEIGCRAQRMFHEGDYQALDRLIREAAIELNDLPDGSSSLSAIYSALSTQMYEGGYDVEGLMGRTADWRRAVDDPLMAELAEVMVFQQWAWTARGHGVAKEVSAMGWHLFGSRSEMAQAGLEDIQAVGQHSPIWHDLSLDVALDLSRDKQQIREIFDRGSETFPEFLPLYAGMMRVLMPRWLGTHEEVDQFIQEQVRRNREEPDLALYARLYWQYFLLEQDDCDIFTEARASWPDVDDGFLELRRQWPASDYLLNAHAMMACLARDHARYAELRPAIMRRMSSPAWSDNYSLASCDRAMRWAP